MTSSKMNLQFKRADDSISHVTIADDHTVYYITVLSMKNTTVLLNHIHAMQMVKG